MQCEAYISASLIEKSHQTSWSVGDIKITEQGLHLEHESRRMLKRRSCLKHVGYDQQDRRTGQLNMQKQSASNSGLESWGVEQRALESGETRGKEWCVRHHGPPKGPSLPWSRTTSHPRFTHTETHDSMNPGGYCLGLRHATHNWGNRGLQRP